MLLTKSSKEGTADGQDMGSETSMLERNPQREKLREGKEPGAWGEDQRSSVDQSLEMREVGQRQGEMG